MRAMEMRASLVGSAKNAQYKHESALQEVFSGLVYLSCNVL